MTHYKDTWVVTLTVKAHPDRSPAEVKKYIEEALDEKAHDIRNTIGCQGLSDDRYKQEIYEEIIDLGRCTTPFKPR